MSNRYFYREQKQENFCCVQLYIYLYKRGYCHFWHIEIIPAKITYAGGLGFLLKIYKRNSFFSIIRNQGAPCSNDSKNITAETVRSSFSPRHVGPATGARPRLIIYIKHVIMPVFQRHEFRSIHIKPHTEWGLDNTP